MYRNPQFVKCLAETQEAWPVSCWCFGHFQLLFYQNLLDTACGLIRKLFIGTIFYAFFFVLLIVIFNTIMLSPWENMKSTRDSQSWFSFYLEINFSKLCSVCPSLISYSPTSDWLAFVSGFMFKYTFLVFCSSTGLLMSPLS